MSLHRSLKTKPTALNQHRNVLTRAERIEKLTLRDRFASDKNSPLGLPKVLNVKVSTGKKKKKAEEDKTEEGEAGATTESK